MTPKGPIRMPSEHRHRILAEVARKHGLDVAEMTGPARDWCTVHARHEASYRLRSETDLSSPAIARLLGVKDHTTVLMGARSHAARLEKEHGVSHWTEQDETFLRQASARRLRMKDILQALPAHAEHEIRIRMKELGCSLSKVILWSPEDDRQLTDAFQAGFDDHEIRARFFPHRSIPAVETRRQKFGLMRARLPRGRRLDRDECDADSWLTNLEQVNHRFLELLAKHHKRGCGELRIAGGTSTRVTHTSSTDRMSMIGSSAAMAAAEGGL